MHHHAIPEPQSLPRLDRDAAVARFIVVEIALAERIRGEQAIAPRMPVCRMLRVPWMIEDRDPHLLAFELARVIHPVRALAPDCLLALRALGIHHQARALRA